MFVLSTQIHSTYSMSEQMPISQPPTSHTKPGSVGVPVAASIAIVSPTNLLPLPYGTEGTLFLSILHPCVCLLLTGTQKVVSLTFKGEIAILASNTPVMQNYLDNPLADAQSYFYLTSSNDDKHQTLDKCCYFLTGDIGVMDKDGFLYLRARSKEMIKKGGEQISPLEVKQVLLGHDWVKLSVCVSVPSKRYGEEVGCAVVLSTIAPAGIEEKEVITKLRRWMKECDLAPYKVWQ